MLKCCRIFSYKIYWFRIVCQLNQGTENKYITTYKSWPYFCAHCRTDLNLCAAYNNNNTDCIHHFRWSFSSIYLFMEPRLVSDMALNYLPGTQIRIQQVHLTIPEICDNVTITIDEEQNQWERSVLLLNKLTTFVSIIICINFILTGIITLVKKK